MHIYSRLRIFKFIRPLRRRPTPTPLIPSSEKYNCYETLLVFTRGLRKRGRADEKKNIHRFGDGAKGRRWLLAKRIPRTIEAAQRKRSEKNLRFFILLINNRPVIVDAPRRVLRFKKSDLCPLFVRDQIVTNSLV